MKWKLFLIFLLIHANQLLSQDEDVRMFVFGHSLINHEFQINPTPSQETSVPHWFHFLSQSAGENYYVSGQYGFLPQHANLPPIAQWGFDFVEGAWDSDYDPFAEANFTDILITPGNFIQWQAPDENYFNEEISPLGATNSIIEWCAQQEDDLSFYIYENWPDMAEYLGSGFPPNESEWASYNQYLQSDFVDWFEEYYQLVKEANPDNCIKLIPVGRLISELLEVEPYSQIPIDQLYEDDAPHGRANIYFLASMISYMAINEKSTPDNYIPTDIINPIIRDNYISIGDFFWERLEMFNDQDNASKVFCETIVSVEDQLVEESRLKVQPNPSNGFFELSGFDKKIELEIFDINGRCVKKEILAASNSNIDLSRFDDGVYILRVKNKKEGLNEALRLIKM